MVDTEAELRREEAAIIRDLMPAGGRTVRKLRAPVPFLLGKVDTQGMLDSEEESRRDAEASLTEQRTALERPRSAERALRDEVAELERLTAPGLTANLAEFDRVAQDRADAEMRQQQLEAAQDRAPIEVIRAARAVFPRPRRPSARPRRRKDALRAPCRACASIGAVERSIADLRDKVEGSLAYADRVMVASQAVERRAVLIAVGDPGRPEFDRVLMEEEFALIKHPVDDPRWLPAALEHLDGYVLFRSDKRLAGTEDAFLESIREYLRRSDLPRPACVPAAPLFDDVAGDVSDDDPMATIDAVAACVAGEDANLRDNEIVRKEAEAAQARLEAIQTFKEDFVGKMRGAFDVMGGLLGELNRQLRKRSFHGLAYRFARQEAPGYRDMARLSSGHPTLGWRKPLFDSDGREPHVLPPPSARGAAGGRVRGLHRGFPEPHRASGAAPSAPRGPDATPPVPLGRRRRRRRAHRRTSGGQPRDCGRSAPDGRIDRAPLRACRARGRREGAQPAPRSGRDHRPDDCGNRPPARAGGRGSSARWQRFRERPPSARRVASGIVHEGKG
ncbi:hypothetical protein FHW79_002070 [Azospirillum sp. OGB3]|nr:hypothetical protein [Azospirillum sp. OGB3]